MLIRRTKPIARSPIDIGGFGYGALFTPGGARDYLRQLCDWVTQNAWDAETYFWDMGETQFRRLGVVSTDLETTCTSILMSADDAINEILHTLSDLCARSYTYTLSWDSERTQYAPHVQDIMKMVKEQATLVYRLSENPRYSELFRRYCGYAGPHHVVVDPEFEDRPANGDPLYDALDDIWTQACELIERLGPNFPPVYTGGYQLGRTAGDEPCYPTGYVVGDWDDPNVVYLAPELTGDPASYSPAFRLPTPRTIIERMDHPDMKQHVGKDAVFEVPYPVPVPPPEYSDIIPIPHQFGVGIRARKLGDS